MNNCEVAMEGTVEKVHEQLFALADTKCANFARKLIPTVPSERILGVRLPLLRNLAKWVVKEGYTESYLDSLPPRYLEDELLMGFTIMRLGDVDTVLYRLEALLPYLSSWASTDSLLPPVFKRRENHARLIARVEEAWLLSSHEYTARYALRVAMAFLLVDYPELVLGYARDAQHPGYYVQMMRGWLVAEALVHHEDMALDFLRGSNLPGKVERIAVRKALESRRVKEDIKGVLRTL